MIFEIVLLIMLIIFSVIDIKFMAIPSALLTAFLILCLVLNPSNIIFGLGAYLIILLFYEVGNGRVGIADFKIGAMIGLTLNSMHSFITFAIVFAVLQFLYVFLMSNTLKKKKYPFIPCLTLVYLTLLIMEAIL